MLMGICILAVACSKDANESEQQENAIIGKWECVHSSVTRWVYEDTWNPETQSYTYTYHYETFTDESKYGYMGHTYNFKSDGTVETSGGNTYTYTISDNKLLLAGGLIKYTIEKLSKSELILTRTYSGIDHNGDSYTEPERYEYKKIN